MQRVRAAFQLRLAELLTQQHRLQCRATATHTDVLKVRLVQAGKPQRTGHQGCQGVQGDVPVGRVPGDQGYRQQRSAKCSDITSFATSSHRMGLCSEFEWPINGSHRS